MERRFNEVSCRSEQNKIFGTASVTYDGSEGSQFHLFDNVYERIAPGAFDESLTSKRDVVALYNHDQNQILGRVSNGRLSLRADSKGLHYEIDPTDTSYARDLRANIEAGNVKGSSFAFQAEEVDWLEDGKNDIRFIKKARLFDISPVTDPAYSSSKVGIRSTEERKKIEEEHAKFETQKRKLIVDKYLQKRGNTP